MLHTALDTTWAVAALAIVAAAIAWLARRTGRLLDGLGLGATCLALIVGAHHLADYGAAREADEQRERLLGLASVFAAETEALGHARIGLDTPADDSRYLRLVDRQRRWVGRNPEIADVYTYRLLADGSIGFIVDSETDYDRNGDYAGELEGRTAIGERYLDATREMRAALAGEATVEAAPNTDDWGIWVTAFAPLHDARGAVEGALGVDFAADDWIADQTAERMHVYALATALLALNLVGGIFVLLGRKQREKLQRAYERAEAGARAKADFLAVMSHEIRTPMNGVLGMAELLLRGPLEAEQRGYVEAIDGSARHLLGVLNDVLDFSRGERGAVQFEAAPAPLRELLEEVARMHRSAAQAKGIALAVHADDALAASHLVDALRLTQVLNNLVGNAVKFTGCGGVSLTAARLGADAAGGERVRFEVRDSGVGIAPDALGAIFEPFRQADGSTARRFGGSGLGLAIAKRLVESFGGSLAVESQPGSGSRFWFDLALAIAPEPARAARVQPRDGADLERRRRVLLVEDDATNQRVAQAMLETLGCDVVLAPNGDAALALAGEPFDLVLMDCRMPVRDGYATTAEWRRREPTGRRVPIVALTAHALPGEREKCAAAGMDDYATKPFTLARLEALVARWAGPAPRQGNAPHAAALAAHPSAPPGEALLDPSALAALRELDPKDEHFLPELADEFAQRASELAADARAALARSDARTLRAIAHQLKSSSAQLGAVRAAEAARALEQAATDGAEPSALAPLVQGLEASLGATLPALLAAARGAPAGAPRASG